MQFDPRHARVLRARRGLTVRELGKLADVSPSLITLFEQGKRVPSQETLEALARGLRCDIDALYKIDVDPTSPTAVAS